MQLAVGQAQTLVEVNADIPAVIDTQSSTLNYTIPNEVMQNMPELTWQHGDVGVYGVVFYSPGVVMPGVNNVGNTGGDTGSSTPISGARQDTTFDTMDGMTVMAYVDNEGGGPVQPSRSGIQELHTVLADAPAEFWSQAAITVVTKSGNNQLHGSLFEDYNGSALNFRLWEQKTLQFRADATDVFNHANFDIPDQTVTDGPGVGGAITALSAANLSQATSGARQFDFEATFRF